jgi:hypothetical protein
MTNQELQSAIMSTVAGGTNKEVRIVYAIQACVYVEKNRICEHLYALRSSRLRPIEKVQRVLRFIAAKDWRLGEGTYEVI